MTEENAERCVVELAPQLVHLIDKQFQGLHLNFRTRETIDDRAVLVSLLKQFAKQ